MKIYQSPFLPGGAIFIIDEPKIDLMIRPVIPMTMPVPETKPWAFDFGPMMLRPMPFQPIIKSPSLRQLRRELRGMIYAAICERHFLLALTMLLLTKRMDQARARNSKSPRFAKRKFRNAS